MAPIRHLPIDYFAYYESSFEIRLYHTLQNRYQCKSNGVLVSSNERIKSGLLCERKFKKTKKKNKITWNNRKRIQCNSKKRKDITLVHYAATKKKLNLQLLFAYWLFFICGIPLLYIAFRAKVFSISKSFVTHRKSN